MGGIHAFVRLSTWLQLLDYCNITPVSKVNKSYSRKKIPLNTTSYVDIVQRMDKIQG